MAVLLGALVFCLAAFLDYSYTRWFDAVKSRKRWTAATWAVVVGGIGTLAGYAVYNTSPWYAIPELTGFFFGTAFAVKPHG